MPHPYTFSVRLATLEERCISENVLCDSLLRIIVNLRCTRQQQRGAVSYNFRVPCHQRYRGDRPRVLC